MDKLNPRHIYEVVCNGDSVTDEQIKIGIDHYNKLSDLLSVSGPVFKLAANEAQRVAYSLQGFKNARDMH